MILTISKDPQFTPDGDVVLGQCEPYTSGWRLRVIEKKHEEVLLTGVYYDLRRVQQACEGKSIEEIRRIVETMGREIKESHVDVERTRIRERFSNPEESTAVMDSGEVQTGMAFEEELQKIRAKWTGGIGPGGSFSALEKRNGLIVARLGGSRLLSDPATSGMDMATLFELSPRGMVVDLDDVEVISSGGIRELVRFADRCTQENCLLALANVKSGIRKVFEMASLESLLPSQGSLAQAIQVLGTHLESISDAQMEKGKGH